jgi:hypothetical protein
MKSDPLISALSSLLFPKRRELGLKHLEAEGLLDSESCARLRERLSGSLYNHRGMARHIVSTKLEIDEYVRANRFCALSPSKAAEQLPRQVRVLSDSPFSDMVRPNWLSNKRVLDFGAGRLNLLNNAIILYANGAENVYALEPGAIDWPLSVASAAELIKHIHFAPSEFNLGNWEDARVRERLAELDLEALVHSTNHLPQSFSLGPIKLVDSIDEIPTGIIDISISNSVLEHVIPFEEEITKLLRVSSLQTLGIHTVDFTSHDKTTPNYDPFDVYYADAIPGLNRLRPSDIAKCLESFGLKVSETAIRNGEFISIDRDRMKPNFRQYEADDLVRLQSTFLFQR